MGQPTALSLVPPLLALVLAVTTRNVLLSLALGVLLGMTLVNGWNPLAGLVDFFEQGIFAQFTQRSNVEVLVIILVIGGFVHLLDRSGGMVAFARRMTKVVDTPFKAQISVWLTGLAIFFTDSGNSLILGPMFRPIFRGSRLCREKLAFIIDSTSSPVCVLVPVISWGVYIMGLLEKAFEAHGVDVEPLDAVVRALPYQLYPILALLTVPVLAWTGREYGPMARAQRRSLEEDAAETPAESHEGPHASARAVLIPLAVLLVTLTGLFVYFGVTSGGLPGPKVRLSLMLAYVAATVVCGAIVWAEGVSPPARSARYVLRGMGKLVFVVLILLLAWSLGDVCDLLGTGAYIGQFFDRALHPGLLPAMVFILGAVFSLSTGSSWGTFALLMPIAIPVALATDAPLYPTIAAVLSGGIFGDHCSPVSDTTVLSSMATGCKHADHVNTQLVYAALTGATTLVGFLVVGFTGSAWVIVGAVVIQIAAVLGVTRVFGRVAVPS